MAKITYLFGAGASAKCLPTVKEIPARLDKFIEFIKSYRTAGKFNYEHYGKQHLNNINAEEEFISYCEVLKLRIAEHQSVDTFAKKLYITRGDEEYIKLKVILSCFFIYEQYLNKTDDRYDAFFASILSASPTSFIGDIKILSWNYDFQIEKAYSAYSKKNTIGENQFMLNVFPRNIEDSTYQIEFGVFKLNGTTAFRNPQEDKLLYCQDSFECDDYKNLVRVFVDYYIGCIFARDKIKPVLSFAWESKVRNVYTGVIELAEKAIKDTEVLVIIGYSIPFFNREVDRYLMKAMSTLEKVYIQDSHPDNVEDNFESVWTHPRKPKIILKHSVTQFFLPPEL
jgi:hypothetical protein